MGNDWSDKHQYGDKRAQFFFLIGHALLKDDSEPCKAALQWNLQGTRGRERPRNLWRQTALNEYGKRSWSDLRFIARDREGWRRLATLKITCTDSTWTDSLVFKRAQIYYLEINSHML
jgi:hypothetical protein